MLSWEPTLQRQGRSETRLGSWSVGQGPGLDWHIAAQPRCCCIIARAGTEDESLCLHMAPDKVVGVNPLLGLPIGFLITASFKASSCAVWMLAPSPGSWSPGCGGWLLSCSPPLSSKSRWEVPAHAFYFYSHEGRPLPHSSLQTWEV